MIWAALVAGAMGAGVWLLVRAAIPPARPLRALSDELLEPRATIELRVARRRGQAVDGAAGPAARRRPVGPPQRRPPDPGPVAGPAHRRPARVRPRVHVADAGRRHRRAAPPRRRDPDPAGARRGPGVRRRRMGLPRAGGALPSPGRPPGLVPGDHGLRRRRRHLPGRRGGRRGCADGGRPRRRRAAVRGAGRGAAGGPDEAPQAVVRPRRPRRPGRHRRPASWRRPSSCRPSRARGSGRRWWPRPRPCASAS